MYLMDTYTPKKPYIEDCVVRYLCTLLEATLVSKQHNNWIRLPGTSFKSDTMFDINIVVMMMIILKVTIIPYINMYHWLIQCGWSGVTMGLLLILFRLSETWSFTDTNSVSFFKWMYQNKYIQCNKVRWWIGIPAKLLNIQKDYVDMTHHIHSARLYLG